MNILKLSTARKLLVLLISFFTCFQAVTAQTVNMSVVNCAVTAPNELQFDVTVTNTSAANVLHWNSIVIRLKYSPAFLVSTADVVTWGYVSGSDFPLSLPPNAAPTFTSNPASPTVNMQLQTGNGIYNNATCTAPSIAPGATATVGRFYLRDNTNNFVAGQSVGLAWVASAGAVLYVDCATTVTNFNIAGNRTLIAPCALTIPAACSSPTVNTNPSDQTVCTSGTTTFTSSFTGGAPAPTLLWQVQTGGVGLFADLTEAAPYSGTATNTLTITNPNISLSTNRYRLKANNTCGDVFSNSALLTVTPNGNPGTVTGTLALCAGSLSSFSSNGDAGGSWSSTNTAVATVNNTGIVTAVGAGSSDITYTVTGAGCVAQSSFSTLTVTGSATLAGTAGGPQICSNAAVQSSASQPSGTSFSDGSCNTIATILPSGLVPVTGNINTCVRVEDVVHTYHNIPYVQRVFDIMPATNGANATATITLYYTQAEFDAFNLARGIYPALPTGSGDATGIANLLITQFHGTGTYPGNYNGGVVDLINPDDSKIVWSGAPLNRWEITFDVNGFSGFYLHTSLTNTPLPINLVSFSGRNNGNVNLLEWATSSEQNSNYFELQRSVDGINFVKATSVPAAGNSNTTKNYNYSDNISGINSNVFYYRLKQVDISGLIRYSTIVKLKLNVKGFNVDASPNPFADHIRVQVDAIQKENAVITLNSLDGKRILKQNAALNKGSNAIAIDGLDKLAGGVYLLTVVTDSQKTTIKVVKQ